MNISEINCTCEEFVATIDCPSTSVKPFIQTAVNLYKLRHGNSYETISTMFPVDDYHDGYHNGLRFNDDSYITGVVCDAVATNATETYFKEATIPLDIDNTIKLEGIIKSFVNSLSGSDLDVLILDGIRCSASVDHYYEWL